MGCVREKISTLIQDIKGMGCNFPMLYINLDFIDKMEVEMCVNDVFFRSLKDIEKHVDKSLKNIEDYAALVEIKNKYSEAYIYSKLNSLLVLDKVPENEARKTPDYKALFRGKNIYIELKSLNMLGGNSKHKEIMHDAFESKLYLEGEISKGNSVAFKEGEICPYDKGNADYDPRSVRLVIESLIEKIGNNIKNEQYSCGDTVLLIDFSDQLPIISKPSDALQQHYYDGDSKSQVSGELWNVAFGRLNDAIYRASKFEGESNNDGLLEKQGVLISYPFIKGIVFHYWGHFYSIAQMTRDNSPVIHLLEYISDEYLKV
jgi:hypothetical protein